ncbi:MAG: cold-shock protein [Proteobacteria bacterium]|nr:cold-shock protein [Pseudomonadota bacterium]
MVRSAPVVTPATDEIEGTVKFFNREKGFGFVATDDGSPDVFVNLETLERSGLTTLQPRQRVRVSTVMGQKGPQAESITLL